MRGEAFLIGGVTILVAIGALVFIFWSITDYSENCKIEFIDACEVFTGPTFPLLVIILIIAGLVLIVSTVVYILVLA